MSDSAKPEADAAADSAAERSQSGSNARLIASFTFSVYVAIVACFALPFLSMSCGSVETKPMTGFELVLREEPEFTSRPTDPEDERVVRDALNSASDRATAALVMVVISAGLAIFVAKTKGEEGLATLLVMSGLLGLLVFATLLSGGVSWDEPGLHRHGGLLLAAMLSALAALSAIGVLLAGFEDRGETNPFPGCILISGLTAYALLWLLVFALGGYS